MDITQQPPNTGAKWKMAEIGTSNDKIKSGQEIRKFFQVIFISLFWFSYYFSMLLEVYRLLRLSGGGSLEVLVGTVGDQTADQDDGVEADTEAAIAGAGGTGGGLGFLAGGRVAGLEGFC